MPDLHERFRSLDRVAAPDLWAEVERRVDNLGTAPSMGPVTLGRPAWRGAGADDRPSALHLLFVAAALLVALLLIFAIGAGRPLPAPTVHNGDIVVSWKGNLYGVDPATGNRDTVLECALSVVACENLENQAAWSPDGMSLAFVKTRFGGTAEGPDDLQDAELGLWILDIKTGSVRHLTTCGPDLCHVGIGVAWSPDGGRIALGIGERIDLVDQRGDAATRTIEPGHEVGPLSWSPDGTRLAFSSGGYTGSRVHTINNDGSDLSLVPEPAIGAVNPAWSPDGKRIAYLVYVPQPPDGQGAIGQIWVMDLDGSHQIKLFEGNEPCCFGAAAWAGPIWAPDGTKIAFITANQNHLYAIGADGGNPVDLGVALGRAQPAWRPVP